MKKKEIFEFIDKNNALIGTYDKPRFNKQVETQANKTTDYNVQVNGQNYGHDFLGRFGFYFYESTDGEVDVKKIDKLIKIIEIVGEDLYEFFKTNKINSLKNGYKKYVHSLKNQLQGMITESYVGEDKITDKQIIDDIKEEKNESELNDKLDDIADILTKINKNDLNKLIDLLELKNKNE